jgi:hypothetical protein
MTHGTQLRTGTIALCLALCLAHAASAKPVITTFDVSDAVGGAGTLPVGMAQNGAVAGYYYHNNDARGFIRAPDGTITTFEAARKSQTYAYGINSAGAVIGYYAENNAGIFHGFVRTPDGAITSFDAPARAEASAPSRS